MAKQTEDIEVVEDGRKSKSKLLITIIGVFLLIIISLAVFIILDGHGYKAITEQIDAGETIKPAKTLKQKPIYHTGIAPFIINFSNQSKGKVRYLKIKLKVMARSQAVIDAFILHQPAIQHELLLLFYGQNYVKFNTNEGTIALQTESLTKINDILKSESLPEKLEAVYFTSLIMQ